MAASPPIARVPVEVYLRTSYEPDAEYVDGVIEERPMGEWSHADWQAAVLEFFRSRRSSWNIRAAAELRVQVASNRFRVPDVVITDRSLLVEPIVTHTPIAVIEILSPEDSHTRLMSKLAEYERMGIRTIVVIDPNTGDHRSYRAGVLQPLSREPFDLPGSQCRFDLGEIEKLLD
ncbi:MAG TPA: Uma2 family endonuclease [Terracidiphilus sp.]|nr:Uma2 family endonuclease [Terracidiphilus sp.]